MNAALALVISVAMHVTWNLIARHQPQESHPLWWVLLAHLMILGPYGFYALYTDVHWTDSFALLLAASATANTLYFHALAKAYQHAPVALVYPLVRSSPLMIALVSTLFLGEHLKASIWSGIAISVAGLLLLASSAAKNGDRAAISWSLLAMVSTCVYSLSDKAATFALPSFGSLLGFISAGYLMSWITMSCAIRAGTASWIPARKVSGYGFVIGGLCIGLAYALVIHAMRTLPSALVVACTNAGIVIASLLSIFVFREREHWPRRLAAAAIIGSGIALMNF